MAVSLGRLFRRSDESARWSDAILALASFSTCTRNLAADPSHFARLAALRERMETLLELQGDPRMFGNGQIFDQYKPTRGDGFYEQFIRGDEVDAGWVNTTDFEQVPVSQ